MSLLVMSQLQKNHLWIAMRRSMRASYLIDLNLLLPFLLKFIDTNIASNR